MMTESICFDIGSFSPVSLRLVSDDGLAPLPMPSSDSAERFHQFMDGDVRQTMANIRSAIEIPDVKQQVVEEHVVAEEIAVARPSDSRRAEVPPPVMGSAWAQFLPSEASASVEARPIVEARSEVERPVPDAKPITGAKPIIEATSVVEPRPNVDRSVANAKTVVGAQPIIQTVPVVEPQPVAEGRVVAEGVAVAQPRDTGRAVVPPPVADGTGAPPLPSGVPVSVEARPVVEARSVVDQPVSAAKPVVGVQPIIQTVPVVEPQPVVEGRVVVEGVAVVQPRDTGRAEVQPPVADGVGAPSLPSGVPVSVEARPIVEARPEVDRSVPDAKPITGAKPIIEAASVVEPHRVVDRPVSDAKTVVGAQPIIQTAPVSELQPVVEGRVVVEEVAVAQPRDTGSAEIPPPVADGAGAPSLPSGVPVSVEATPIVEQRPVVDRPVSDAKTVVGAQPIIQTAPVSELQPVVEGRVVVEEVAVAQPRDTGSAEIPPPVADGAVAQSLPSGVPVSVEARPIVEARYEVERSVPDAKPITGAKPIIEATPVVEPRRVVDRPVTDAKTVVGAQPIIQTASVVEPQPVVEGRVVVEEVAVAQPREAGGAEVPPPVADDAGAPSLPSGVPVSVEARPIVEARPVVERPAADAKPITGGTPIIVAAPLSEVRQVVESSQIVEPKSAVKVQPVVKRPVVEESVIKSRVVEMPVSESPVVKPKMTLRRESMDAPLQAAPVSASVAQVTPMVAVQPEAVQQANATTARTEVIAEAVEQIVETVVDRIFATPSLAQGEGEIRIMLRPTVLDGSELSISAKEGTLAVTVMPATPEAARIVGAALPTLEVALAEHAPAFHHVAVVLATAKQGKNNEAA